jgi:molybdopterin synthase catalytic subunit
MSRMSVIPLSPPSQDETWVGLSEAPLPIADALAWVVRPDCGAVVVFSGTARDHAPGVTGVLRLDYEAYDEYVEPVLRRVADEARTRWPDLGRLVVLHRTGPVAIEESAVVIAASAPHRASAFEAARFCIDEVKRTAPIWKREMTENGGEWVRCDHEAVT